MDYCFTKTPNGLYSIKKFNNDQLIRIETDLTFDQAIGVLKKEVEQDEIAGRVDKEKIKDSYRRGYEDGKRDCVKQFIECYKEGTKKFDEELSKTCVHGIGRINYHNGFFTF